MKRISIVWCALATFFLADRAMAQCQGGGGGASAGSGTTTAAGLATTGGATLLTGPGSLAYDMNLVAARQRQLMQLQLLFAQQRAAERQANLAKRQYNAERTRAATAARRERVRQFIAAQNGNPKAAASYALLASR